ncbi:MAG TPA: TonB family protein [Syntrophales bacterium]|nr:TonB family protein [Syntrophales bacterium]
MNEQRIGIVTSLAIHAGFLLLFLTIPVAGAIPHTKTIYISFAQQESLSSASQKEMKPIMRSKAGQQQSITKPEIVEIKDRQDEFLLNEKPVSAAVQKAENSTVAKAEIASIGKAVNRGIAETIFGNSGAPAFIHREMPVYPLLARRLGKEGRVVLELLIDKSGILQHIKVVEPSGFGFTEAAVAAIKKSVFSPAYSNGEKVPSKAILSVRFNLK